MNPAEYFVDALIVPDGGLGGGVYEGRGFSAGNCKDAVVRRTFVLPQYWGYVRVILG